jgi:hypothetical protein
MAKAKLLHLYIRPKSSVTQEAVEEILNKALDWFRYDEGIYILYTTTELNVWHGRLKPLVDDKKGRMLLFLLDPNSSNGWMTKDFWDWLKDKKQKIAKQSEQSTG